MFYVLYLIDYLRVTADLLVVGEGLALVDEPVGAAAGDGAAPPAGLLLRLGVLQPRLLLAAPRPLLRRVAQLHAAADCLQGHCMVTTHTAALQWSSPGPG